MCLIHCNQVLLGNISLFCQDGILLCSFILHGYLLTAVAVQGMGCSNRSTFSKKTKFTIDFFYCKFYWKCRLLAAPNESVPYIQPTRAAALTVAFPPIHPPPIFRAESILDFKLILILNCIYSPIFKHTRAFIIIYQRLLIGSSSLNQPHYSPYNYFSSHPSTHPLSPYFYSRAVHATCSKNLHCSHLVVLQISSVNIILSLYKERFNHPLKTESLYFTTL